MLVVRLVLLTLQLALAFPSQAQFDDPQASAYVQGRKLAEDRIAEGKLEIVTHGMQFTPKSQAEYRARYNTLLERHGIKLVNRGCIVVTSFADNAFNSRMQQEIAARYGQRFWERLEQQARADTHVAP